MTHLCSTLKYRIRNNFTVIEKHEQTELFQKTCMSWSKTLFTKHEDKQCIMWFVNDYYTRILSGQYTDTLITSWCKTQRKIRFRIAQKASATLGLEMARAAKRPANDLSTGVFTGPLTAQFYRLFFTGPLPSR